MGRKKYPQAERGAKILTAMRFRRMWKTDPKTKIKAYMGGDAAGYSYYVRKSLGSRAFGKKGLQELAVTESQRRKR